jgi:hypothetical protein
VGHWELLSSVEISLSVRSWELTWVKSY